MLGRVATYVVPSIAVAATALVLLGPGSQRSTFGVRIRGIAVAGSSHVALRLEGVRRLFGVDDAASMESVHLVASGPDGEFASWEGSLGGDGIGEANLVGEHGAHDWLDLRVSRGTVVLARGRATLRSATPIAAGSGQITGTTSGDLEIHVTATRGYLAAPFWETVRVEVVPKIAGVNTPITVEAEAPGAEIDPPRGSALGARNTVDFRVSPHAHNVELGLVAHDGAAHEGRWEGYLPIRPGALWVDPASRDAILIRSPSPRDRAYLSIEEEGGRVFGAVVPLVDVEGIPTGSVKIPSFSGLSSTTPESARFAVVAGDPYEQGSGSIAWPLAHATQSEIGWAPGVGRIAPPPLELLVDGVPAAELFEAARASSARKIGFAVIGAAALAEVLLLILGTRKAQQRLEQHLGRAFSEGEAEPVPDADRARIVASARASPVLQIAVFAALVALAFALVAAASTFR